MSEVLIIGSGGREDALRQTMEACDEVAYVEVTDNPTELLGKFSKHEKPFVVIGPEQPLVDGLADELRADGYIVLGPSKAAAQYEGSKYFATDMMKQAGIPHPATFSTSNPFDALDYIAQRPPESIVLKANGLAGGKGVVLPNSHIEASDTIHTMLDGTALGAAGQLINISDRHSGPEVSAMAIVGDNDEFYLLPLSQDHKRLLDGDTGPNTGGMGAYAPVPSSIVSSQQYEKIYDIVGNSLAGMREHTKVPFERAVLYVGIMLSEQQNGDPTVIEYNVRFGDPETQVLLPLLQQQGVDTYRLLRSAAEGSLEIPKPRNSMLGTAALTVCLAAPGYPSKPQAGNFVYGLDNIYKDVTIHRAGIDVSNRVSGGRVLYVTGTGGNLDQAATAAYSAIDLAGEGAQSGKIGFDNAQVRLDIGHQARKLF